MIHVDGYLLIDQNFLAHYYVYIFKVIFIQEIIYQFFVVFFR